METQPEPDQTQAEEEGTYNVALLDYLHMYKSVNHTRFWISCYGFYFSVLYMYHAFCLSVSATYVWVLLWKEICYIVTYLWEFLHNRCLQPNLILGNSASYDQYLALCMYAQEHNSIVTGIHYSWRVDDDLATTTPTPPPFLPQIWLATWRPWVHQLPLLFHTMYPPLHGVQLLEVVAQH